MGCGKSKHDVVTGNTKMVRKPLEAESVKGKESCQCRKTEEVSSDLPETTLDNNNTEKAGEDINVVQKTGGKEITTTSPTETVLKPENIVAEDTVNNVIDEGVLPIDEQKEEVDVEPVVEENKLVEDQNEGDVDTETPIPEVVEEPKPDVEIPVPAELEVQEDLSTGNEEIAATENNEIPVTAELEVQEDLSTEKVENAATENDEIPVVEDEEKVEVVEVAQENSDDKAKEVESA